MPPRFTVRVFLLMLVVIFIIALVLVFGFGQTVGIPILVIITFSIIGVLFNRIIKLIYRKVRGKSATYQRQDKQAGKTSKKPK